MKTFNKKILLQKYYNIYNNDIVMNKIKNIYRCKDKKYISCMCLCRTIQLCTVNLVRGTVQWMRREYIQQRKGSFQK